jgi:hypothetical protein
MRRFGLCLLLTTSCLPDFALVDGGGVVDGGADADADGPLPASPEVFGSKLALWLDADDPTTITTNKDGGVTMWRDRSSNQNTALVIVSNDTSASPASSIKLASNVANGHAAMSFTGIWNATGIFAVADNASIEFGLNDFAITVVAAYVNTPGPDEYANRAQFWGKVTDQPPYRGSVMIGNAYSEPFPDGGLGPPDSVIYGGIENFIDGPSAGAWSATDGWNDGQLHVFTLRKDNKASRVYVRTDGIELASFAPISTLTDLSATGQPLQIGGHTINGICCWSVLSGVIAEVIAVNGSTMTSAEMVALGTYLQVKYGLTL